MGNYVFPSFDFHIANSPYTAEEFYRSVKDETNPSRSKRFFNWCWRFFKSPLIPIEERIYVCPRGVDAEQFSTDRKSEKVRQAMIEQAEIPKDSIIILYAGRISPEKNVELLPEFMKILAKETDKDYRLLVAGAGPQSDWLQQETDKYLPNKIIQLGHLGKETLSNFYANADVFVHPNPKEPFGIAPLEAMASGVPTVVPNAGGLLFYATNDNTWLVEPTAENYANSIKKIINDPELRNKKIENALETVQNNTRIRSTDNLLNTYDKMYQVFQTRKKDFTDTDEIKHFDFVKELLR